MQENPIVLFDGVCNYCNAMVNFVICNDKKAIFKFAPLQSDAGKQLKEKYKITREIDSVIFIENEKVYTYSDAAIRIAKHLGWPAKIFYGLLIVPKFIRQPVYKWIARNRYKWFGKKEACMVPTKDTRARFLE
jgi:predicted DCC family thiol-disulfide oxidoreductase YuxK